MKPVITASATWGRQKQVVNTWKLFFTFSSWSLAKLAAPQQLWT